MAPGTQSEPVVDEPKTADPASSYEPLRIWPAIVLLAGMAFFRYLPHLVEDGPPWIWMSAAFGPAICGLLILIWWVGLSQATWVERLAGFFGTILIAAVTLVTMDKSMRGPGVMVLTVPVGTAAFGIGAILSSGLLSFQRSVIALLLACAGFGVSAMVRSDGMWGNFALGLHWRWATSSEDALAKGNPNKSAKPPAQDELARPEWPGFRGPDRDGRQHGTKIATDWTKTPPELVWKHPVGPGWSSFAVAGNFLFTQEQRGPKETVVCYAADSGEEVWTRDVESRFDDPLGGPGPRATPTLADGALYVTFATGPVMRLNPASGEVVWSADLPKLANRDPPTPMWGYASSPLVVGSVVIVHAGGKGDKGILALDKETGALKWSSRSGDHSYASPQLSTLLGEPLVLMLTNAGLNVLDPARGEERLNYEWPFEGYRAQQPQVFEGDSVLLPTPMGGGLRRIRVLKRADQWSVEEVWTSRDLKGDFNDFVVYQGHAYGFDGAIFASIDLATGKRNWKAGRYGKGQVLLLEDSAALLVAGEQGELILLKADPSAPTVLATFQALEGRTWNHPVVIGDRLYLRNSQEAACYRLPLAEAGKD